MLALARRQQIHLPPSRRQRARVLAAHAEEKQLGHVAEIEADPAAIGAAVLAHLVPDDVGLVAEAPTPSSPRGRRAIARSGTIDTDVPCRRRSPRPAAP